MSTAADARIARLQRNLDQAVAAYERAAAANRSNFRSPRETKALAKLNEIEAELYAAKVAQD